MVSPADFIPVAEDSGLIVPIGEWVIQQSLADLRRWNEGRRKKLHIAVNLSARQLRSTASPAASRSWWRKAPYRPSGWSWNSPNQW